MMAGHGQRRYRRGLLCCAALPLTLFVFATSAAGETKAGTVITNTATLRTATDAPAIASNPVSVTVAERLDVTVTGPAAPVPTSPGGTPIPVVVTNTGNGDEAFAVSTGTTPGGPTVRIVAIDVDGDGTFDPARDTVLADGRIPALAPGASVKLVVVVDPGTDPSANSVTVNVRAVTGSGAPGTVIAGGGDAGGDAVIGGTGAAAQVVVAIGAAPGTPTLTKRQTVTGPSGATPVRGATITYALEARFPAATTGAVIADPIPTGAAYVAGSLTLDGAALTDAADADAGSVDAAAGIRVALGDAAAGAVRTVQFQVTIQ